MSENNSGNEVLMFAIGGLIGAGLSLLLAPCSGEETRRRLAAWINEGKDQAKRFVAERYRQVRLRKHLSVNFFPFETPNILFTSPDGKVEVFVQHVKETRFACILGEHLTAAVDPVSLYREVAQMLYDSRAIYIEVINDAADVSGTECILRAGFVPCGYMPCLKHTGDTRRDYAVFARSYEYFTYPRLKVNSLYMDYLRAYCKARAAMSAHDA